MSGFYKMDPAAWDFGTSELSLEEEAAYLRIVNAIHKHDAPVPNVDRVIAGLFRCSTRKARALVSALVEAGKVTIEDGKIWNERARSDMVQRQLASGSASIRGSKGGRTRAENAAKALKNNEPPQATASSRIEENRIEEKREAKASQKSPTGTRLPSDWVLPKDWGDWALDGGWDETTIREQAERFRDYWIGVPGAKGRKLDWQATFRNWMRDKPKSSLKLINGGQYAKPASRGEERMRAFLAGARSTS